MTSSKATSRLRLERERVSPETRGNETDTGRLTSSISNASSSIGAPFQIITAKEGTSESAFTGPLTSGAKQSKHGNSLKHATSKAMLIGPTDYSVVMPGSSSEQVQCSLQEIYCELTANRGVDRKAPSPYSRYPPEPHPVVERWVDYSDRYGIGYVLSDGSAGIALKSSQDNSRSSSYVVIRYAKEHYVRRLRHRDVQIVPQGPRALPVEFYERIDKQGIRKMKIPARQFFYDQSPSERWVEGNEVVSQLSKQASGAQAVERVRLIGLLDKFGKYMNNVHCAEMTEEDDGDGEEAKKRRREMGAIPDSFIKFYQRLGNVGIWGFGDGSFQFNFPDHTKLILHQTGAFNSHERLVLDLYYLQPEDATYLAQHGSMPEGSMERRRSFTTPIAEIMSLAEHDGGQHDRRTTIFTSNQIHEKLCWIRALIGVWIREGGLGRTGHEKLAWAGLQERVFARRCR